ncbi:hypothetical protein ANO11243_091640 [Dothideomycetidae sp. 11243]|nr:hypothetical protein ANO11243_091640 [fungal sp. No.11243]
MGSKHYTRDFLGGHASTVFDILIYDNASRFISLAPKENTIVAWDLEEGVILWKKTHDQKAMAATLSAGMLVLGTQDGEIRVLRLQDGAENARFSAHPHSIHGMVANGSLLVSTDSHGWVKLWAMHGGAGPSFVRQDGRRLYDQAVTHRIVVGDWLVCAGKNGGGERNICGLDCRLKILRLHGDPGDIGTIQDIGAPVARIWGVAQVGTTNLTAVSLMKRGVPMLEIWKNE